MRGACWLVGILSCAACGQKVDHPAMAATCDPAIMKCRTTLATSGSGSSGHEAAAGAGSTDEGPVAVSGKVIQFADDYFDQGPLFSSRAKVSAAGENGGRVSADYDGASFHFDAVLEAPANWFLVEPEGQTALPTLTAVDTRSLGGSPMTLGVATNDALRQIFLNSGTDASLQRAQLEVHVLDAQQRSLSGVRGTLSLPAEVTQYRMAATWVPDAQSVTDDSGMLFFGNVAAGTELTAATLILSGSTSSRLTVELKTGALTVVTVIAPPK